MSSQGQEVNDGPIEIGPIVLRVSDRSDSTSTSLPMAIGTIVDVRYVRTTKGTVIDPEASRRGGIIRLPFKVDTWHKDGTTDSIYVPRFWHTYQGAKIQLHPIGGIANSVARACEEYKRGQRTDRSLKRLVSIYWETVMRFACGKQGLLSSSILGCRVMNSGRGVLLPNAYQSPFSVGVPQEMMSRIKIAEDDLVIVGRDPTIWHGSIEILKAIAAPGSCIQLHPLVFKQLGADADGDEVYIMRIPDLPGAKEAAQECLGSFMMQHSRWPSYLSETNPDRTVDWNTIEDENIKRCTVTGFSVSPADVLDSSEHIKQLCARTGKDVVEECKKIALGISREEVEDYIGGQNDANLKMKLGLGPIGQLCTRIVAICGMNANLIKSGSYISERLSQEVLDQKHTVTTNRVTYDPKEIIDLFYRRGMFKNATFEDAQNVLEAVGLEKVKCAPFIAYLWYGYPLMRTMHILCKETEKFSRCLAIIGMARDAASFARVCKRLAKNWGVDEGTVTGHVATYSHPLDDIFSGHYPALSATEAATERDGKIRERLCRRIFLSEHEDSLGPSRVAMKVSLRKRDAALRVGGEPCSL